MGLAYKRKTIFVEFSNNVVGNRFKFKDFFASLNIEYNYPSFNDPNLLSSVINIENINMINVGTTIIQETPFITSERKLFLTNLWKEYIKTYTS